jgi:hypothetical protein
MISTATSTISQRRARQNPPSPTPIITKIIGKFYKLRRKIFSHLMFFLTLSAILMGCSNNPLAVSDTKWDCHRAEPMPICEIAFILENSSHFPIAANVLIRTHHRSGNRNFGTISNQVVGEKTISLTTQPNEKKEIQEKLEVKGRVTKMFVAAWGDPI